MSYENINLQGVFFFFYHLTLPLNAIFNLSSVRYYKKKQKSIHQNIKLLITTSDSTINLREDWITLQTQDFHSEFLCGF